MVSEGEFGTVKPAHKDLVIKNPTSCNFEIRPPLRFYGFDGFMDMDIRIHSA